MYMNDNLRLNIIQEIEDATSNSTSIDMSRFFAFGLSPVDIGLILTATTLLRSEPYLKEHDLIEHGIGIKQIQRVLGGLEHFKTLLGVDDYSFADYLKDRNLDIGSNIAVPYFIYQQYFTEIRAMFSLSSNPKHLKSTLMVEIEEGFHLSHIPIFDNSIVLIPATAAELMLVSMNLLINDYCFIHYDHASSILTLKPILQDRFIDIEVRCYSSEFKHKCGGGICIIDDVRNQAALVKKTKVMCLRQLMERVNPAK